MAHECRVCGKTLRSEKSRELGAGPVCLRKEREKFGHDRRTPPKNQLSFDKPKDILDHYKNNLDSRVMWGKEEGGKEYEADLVLQTKCQDLWGDEKFFEFLRGNYVQGNVSVDILKNYF